MTAEKKNSASSEHIEHPIKPSIILGIETSCDETAAAVVAGGKEILSSVVSSQVELHSDYGGVVPEVASRAHLDFLLPVVKQAVLEAAEKVGQDIRIFRPDAIAVTSGPGLIGALLVGVSAAKALALAWQIPLISVNHLEAHLYGAFLDEPEVELPLVVLLVSGGHTMLVLMRNHGEYEILGETLDDAAGEAYDKTARILGLGYPGGPLIDELAKSGNPSAVAFPRPMLKIQDLNFSFSGLKTAVANYCRRQKSEFSNSQLADIAASFQASIADVLEQKTVKAVKQTEARAVCVAGGVAANSELRQRMRAVAEAAGIPCYLASRQMCTDNAAMVAAAGWWQIQRAGATMALDSSVNPSKRL